MAKKTLKRAERIEVTYEDQRWMLLKELRAKAAKIMKTLEKVHLFCVVHGSIARGDVGTNSDIDIFVPNPPSSFLVESTLERAGFQTNRRYVSQATPNWAVKGHIELDPRQVISFPLMTLRPLEREFYRFGGEATLQTLMSGDRVAGVDKRLLLIQPTSKGHVESTIVGREETVARLLDVSVEIVLNRVRTLLRRDEVGRTGVFMERELGPDETFELAVKRIADRNPAVRRRLRLFRNRAR